MNTNHALIIVTGVSVVIRIDTSIGIITVIKIVIEIDFHLRLFLGTPLRVVEESE